MPRFPNFKFAHDMGDHFHSASLVYPTLAAGVTINGGAGAWELGAFTEVIPVNTITLDFDIHWINFANASAADTYELNLYYGASDTLIATRRITITGYSIG